MQEFVTKNLKTIFATDAARWYALLFAFVLSTGGLLSVMNFFNPLDIGPYGLLSFFLLLYFSVYFALLLVYRAASRILPWRFDFYAILLAIALVSVAPVMLLALSTLGQLKLTDGILVLLFEGIAIFYIFRRRRGRV